MLGDEKDYRICPCIIRTFFGQNEHVKLGVRIIQGVLYLVKQRKFWSEIWGCVLYMGAYYTRVNTVQSFLYLDMKWLIILTLPNPHLDCKT